jgi:hypothetical protein
MTGACNYFCLVVSLRIRSAAASWQIALSEDRVVRTFFPWAFWLCGAEDYFAVPVASATLGAHEVIVFAHAEHVRTLNPYRVLLHMSATAQNLYLLAYGAVALNVEIVEEDRTLSLVVVSTYRLVVVYDVAASVFIKIE